MYYVLLHPQVENNIASFMDELKQLPRKKFRTLNTYISEEERS